MPNPIGRPPSCTCGECKKCIQNRKQREAYAQLPPEVKRARLDDRQARRGAEIAEYRREQRRKGREAKHAAPDPIKHSAWRAVQNAIRANKLIPRHCIACGSLVVEAHHRHYDRPLEVIWLCRKHHAEIHRKIEPKKLDDWLTGKIGPSRIFIRGVEIPQERLQELASKAESSGS